MKVDANETFVYTKIRLLKFLKNYGIFRIRGKSDFLVVRIFSNFERSEFGKY